jgi:hypothetical protein
VTGKLPPSGTESPRAPTGSTWSDRHVGAISRDTQGFCANWAGSFWGCFDLHATPFVHGCMHACCLLTALCFSVTSSQFEQGIYCETFHSEEGGWRNCETCGKVRLCVCMLINTSRRFVPADSSVPLCSARADSALRVHCIYPQVPAA